ncbi:universal stress protein [Paraburkholderia bannensis]|uniref:universal stress protein n=1 Tax=Paraburkholderia bannensis TaxID=765414 RepID=UPI000484D2B6|nr:universal stress protein [Paraburkholderia bannensis]
MDNSKSGRSANSPLKMLIAVDHSEASLCAVRFACELAPTDSAIRIVSVVLLAQSILPPGDATTTVLDSIHDDLARDATQALSSASEICMRAGIRPETAIIDLSVQGTDVVYAILDAAASWHADLIVVGAHQHHLLVRWLEGNVSEALVRFCARPMLIVPQCSAEAPRRPDRILFAVGSVADAQKCLRYGMRFATTASCLRAVHAVGRSVAWPGERRESIGEESAMVLEAARQILEGFSRRTTTGTIGPSETSDDVANAIVSEAVKWGADLLVMGTHSMHGLKRFAFGSVAHRVLHITRTPLLLVNMES